MHVITKISKTGTIYLPLNLSLKNKEAEVMLIKREMVPVPVYKLWMPFNI